MHTLVQSVYIVGRIPNSHRQTAEDSPLEDVLQLESNTGIYTSDGAKKGEDVLYQAVQHELVVSTISAVNLGVTSDPETIMYSQDGVPQAKLRLCYNSGIKNILLFTANNLQVNRSQLIINFLPKGARLNLYHI